MKKPRGIQRNADSVLLTERDWFALSWIGQQYGIRLDQLQRLLGQRPGRGAQYNDWISAGATRDVVTRWKRAGWVKTGDLQIKMPFWIFVSTAGLRLFEAPFAYRDLARGHDLNHLYAINEVRLALDDPDLGTRWTSERQLLQGIVHQRGHRFPHRPDGVLSYDTGRVLAIEVELSHKTLPKLEETVIELVRGDEYLRLKAEYGTEDGRWRSGIYSSPYTQICYYGPKSIRQRVRMTLAKLVKDGILRKEEALRFEMRWYPLAQTKEDLGQEALEEEGF